MKKSKFATLTVAAIAIFCFGVCGFARADEEALGRKAEQAGKLRQALGHYVSALQSASEGSSTEQRLREKIIRLAPKIQPPPAVPEEAERYMARGEAFVEVATDKNGFLRAAKEFQAAAGVAPWLANAYYNLGIVQDKAGQYKKAMQSLEFYLLAAPSAPDAREVRNLIYKIEARSEASRSAARKEEEEKKKGIESLAGIWRQYLGSNGYNWRVHFRAETAGDDLLITNVVDNHPQIGPPGYERPLYIIREEGNKFAGRTVDYDSSLSTQEIGVTASKNYNELKITVWEKLYNIGKQTYTYHKCKNTNPSSCGM